MSANSVGRAIAQLEDVPYSHLQVRGDCCVDSKMLLLASLMAEGSGPDAALARLAILKPWGPTRWPASWCDAHEAAVLDCGAHTAIASAILEAFGIAHRRARLVVAVGEVQASVWATRWTAANASLAWMAQHAAHHEVIAVGSRLWDASSACWVGPLGSRHGGGRLAAIRVEDEPWATTPVQQ